MVTDSHVSLLSARTPDELRRSLLELTAEMDFGLFGATLSLDRAGQSSDLWGVDNCPQEHAAQWSDPDWGRADPVLQHLKTSNRPLAWDRKTYLRHGCADQWEVQAAYGYKVGVCAVLHLPGREHFVFGVDRNEPLPKDQAQLADLVARVQLLTVYAHEAALRVSCSPQHQPFSSALDERERECLQWTMEGKTAWEIGRILSMSERKVAGLLSSATRKLECVNKQQAVVKALRLGLLDLH
jgi:DNA-binding CsgD family transcriptional regulator